MTKVFLSSVVKGLEPFRQAVYEAIHRLDDHHCIRMEDFGARARDSAVTCRDKVEECDVFVGIVGHRYGSCPPDSDLSYSEREYDIAKELGLRILMYVAPPDLEMAVSLREDDDLYKRQQAFRNRVLSTDQKDTFNVPGDLATAIVTALHNLGSQQQALAGAQQIEKAFSGTTLLFPFASNRFGFDTGLSIANTSARPQGGGHDSGPCTIFYYGTIGDDGATPEPQVIGDVQPGETLSFTLGQGNAVWLVNKVSDFQGYVIVVCGFRNAYGFAFLSEATAAPNFASGYLARDITGEGDKGL